MTTAFDRIEERLELQRRQSAEKMQAVKRQKPCDHGLFDTGARNQLDLVEAADRAREESDKMIVHGLPINGDNNGAPAIEALAGGSFLASYWYTRPGRDHLTKQVERVIELVGEDEVFLLDNGAFTAFKNGVDLATDDEYLDGFYEWAGGILERCPQAMAILPDVIDGSEAENDRLLRESPLDPFRCMAVWHLDESLPRLGALVRDYNSVALGSSGAYWNVGNAAWRDRIQEVFDFLDTIYADPEFAAAYVKPRLHMLRGIGQQGRYRFDSADSANVAMNWRREGKRGTSLEAFRARVEDKARESEGFGDLEKIGTPAEVAGILEDLSALVKPPATERKADIPHVLAFGAGVDSTALLAIELNRDRAAAMLGIEREKLDHHFPPLDAVVFSDPGAEFPQTYENVERAAARCKAAGLAFHTVRKDGENIIEWLDRLGNVPLLPGGSHVCSLKFKGEVMQRWAEKEFAGNILWSVGIEATEPRRCARFTPPKGGRHRFHYPLVDINLGRQECEQLVRELWGHDVHKSSCFFCPYMQEEEIRELHWNHPVLWDRAKQIERKFRETSKTKHQRWLDAGKPLDRAGRALRGMWRKNAYAEGARLFAKAKAGKRLNLEGWEARFRLAPLLS